MAEEHPNLTDAYDLILGVVLAHPWMLLAFAAIGVVGIIAYRKILDPTPPTVIVNNHPPPPPAPLPAPAPPPAPHPNPAGPAVRLNRLPAPGAEFVGRAAEFAWLEACWHDDTAVAVVVGEGGAGKSALVVRWLDTLRRRGWDGAAAVTGFSFFSQGSSERQGSAGPFADEVLAFLGGDTTPTQNPWALGERLAACLRRKRTLLVLDGLEPLQYPPGAVQPGAIKEPIVQALLAELAHGGHPGLVVVTTRAAVADLAGLPAAQSRDLGPLSAAEGADLLRRLAVDGSDGERRAAAGRCHGHAYTLTLLGTYLRDACGGDLRRAAEINLVDADAAQGGRARAMLERYIRWFGDRPEGAVLALTGLFDRPADGELVRMLRQAAIPGLTAPLADLPETQWRLTLTTLRRAHLLEAAAAGDPDTLDAHPLVRAFFADRLKREDPAAWRQAHSCLYEHLRDSADDRPETRAAMTPLFQAVGHGCAAGRHQEALVKVVYPRIRRGGEHFSVNILGALGDDLLALAGLFAEPWQRPAATLAPQGQAWVLAEAGSSLHALGRLDEARQAMAAALERIEQLEEWGNARATAENLSETEATRGALPAAIAAARRAIATGDRGASAFERIRAHATLAAALVQAGKDAEATELFAEAERRQIEDAPRARFLVSYAGFHYCGVLLDQGRWTEVRERAEHSQEIFGAMATLLTGALDTLSLARAAVQAAQAGAGNWDDARRQLDAAVAALRAAGRQDHLPRGLLARAEFFRLRGTFDNAERDLAEAATIAGRGSMKLFLADIALERARLHLAQGQSAAARTELATGRALVEACGYHRRDGAVAELAKALG
ncbi:MAG: NACHT domain-containing protein [Magnetospirillum sp.]|nr:NACHT domain-containing protein [Magnetospirillum sp.]